MLPKEYFCCEGHQFNGEDAKEWLNEDYGIKSGPLCPLCWPDGFDESKLTKEQRDLYNKVKIYR